MPSTLVSSRTFIRVAIVTALFTTLLSPLTSVYGQPAAQSASQEANPDQVGLPGLQDGLGLSFLPRFWRSKPDAAIGSRLWRPAAMAAHELLQQHRALDERLRRNP